MRPEEMRIGRVTPVGGKPRGAKADDIIEMCKALQHARAALYEAEQDLIRARDQAGCNSQSDNAGES